MYGNMNPPDSEKVLTARRNLVDAFRNMHADPNLHNVLINQDLAFKLMDAWQAYDAAIIEQHIIRSQGPG